MAVRYLNSLYSRRFRYSPANTYENDTNVPIVVLHNFTGVHRPDGLDIVVTNVSGALVPRTVSVIQGGFAIYIKDPAQTIAGGGTLLDLQWGGNLVNEANDLTTWQNCHGSTNDYVLVVHGEEASANLIDDSGNYTATDANITYDQTGVIGQAPSFNGLSSNVNWGDVTQLNSQPNFTILFWFKPNALVLFNRFIYKSPSSNDYINIYYGAANEIAINFRKAGISNQINYAYVAADVIGTYGFISFSFDGAGVGNTDKVKHYMDGVEKIALSESGTIPTTTPNLLGSDLYQSHTAQQINGVFDEFRLFTGTLSGNQTKTQYDNQRLFSTNGSLILSGIKSFLNAQKQSRISISNSISI